MEYKEGENGYQQYEIHKQEPTPRRVKREPDMRREMKLADVIYMFVAEGENGILLYDRSDDISARDLAETLKEGEFITDTVSCQSVEWDDRVNVPNESLRVRYVEGSRKETTYIVSREKMIEVLSAILEANKENRSYIKLDSKEKTPLNKVNAPEEYMNSNYDKKRLLEELQGKVNQIIAENEPTNKKEGKIKGITPKDIVEADVENKVASSEMNGIDQQLLTHKEYENYIDNN